MSIITVLEGLLINSGREDWEIMYDPDVEGYYLKLDGDVVFICEVCTDDEEEPNNERDSVQG